MAIRWLVLACSLLAVPFTASCGSLTTLGSANMGPMIQQFPFHANRPIARELRYTFMSRIMFGDKEHKRIVAADDVTRAQGSLAPSPAAVLSSATAPATRVSDQISEQAREAQRRGTDADTVAAMHGHAAATGGTEAALGRAETAVAVTAAFANFLSALAGAGQWLTDAQAARLAEWVRHDTGTIGPGAPAGSKLQLDFIYVNTGKAYGTDSVTDILVRATLLDGSGRVRTSRRAFQQFTYMGKSSIEIPPDAIPIEPGVVPATKRHHTEDFAGDPMSPHLAVAASSALADLYQLE